MKTKKGIYCIKVQDCIVYVGKTKNLKNRLECHWTSIFKGLDNKYQLLQSSIFKYLDVTVWMLEECEEWQLNDREAAWIEFLKPCLNSTLNNSGGKNIDANTYYDYVFNNSDHVEGMYKVLTIHHTGKKIAAVIENIEEPAENGKPYGDRCRT